MGVPFSMLTAVASAPVCRGDRRCASIPGRPARSRVGNGGIPSSDKIMDHHVLICQVWKDSMKETTANPVSVGRYLIGRIQPGMNAPPAN